MAFTRIRNELLEPLEILFTASFATGQLPEDWRTANIIHNSNLQKKVAKPTHLTTDQ